MSDPKVSPINRPIVRALAKVAKRFEEDPTPTDGSFQAALDKMGMKPKPAARKRARGEKRMGRR